MPKNRIEVIVEAVDKASDTLNRVAQNTERMVHVTQIGMIEAGRVFTRTGKAIVTHTDSMVDSFLSLEDAILYLRRVLPEDADFDAIRKAAEVIGQDFAVSTVDAMQAMRVWAQQTQDVNEIMEMTNNTLMLAAVSELDAAESASVLTSIMMQTGATFGEVAGMVDVFNEVSNRTGVTIADLTTGVVQFGAQGRAVGAELADMVGWVTVLRKAGYEATEAGTSLKSILTRLYRDETGKTLEEIGIATKNADDSFRSASDILGELSDKWDTLTDQQRQNVGETLAGMYHIAKLNSLMQNYGQAVDATGYAYDSAGSATTEFGKVQDTMGFQLAQANEAVMNASQALGESLAPAQIFVAETTAGFAGALSALPEPLVQVGGGIVLVAGHAMAAIGPVIQFVASLKMAGVLDLIMPRLKGLITILGGYKSAALMAGLAVGGLAMAMMAVNASSPEQKALFAALTGITWGLAAAKTALAISESAYKAALTFGIAAPAIAAGVFTVTSAIKSSVPERGGQFGAFIPARQGEGRTITVGEGAHNEWILNEPQMRALIQEVAETSGDRITIQLTGIGKIDDKTAKEFGEAVYNVIQDKKRKRGGL